MTELSMAVLVSADERERYQVVIPGVSAPRFDGASLASLLDDVTLHLMEAIPKADVDEMPRYELNPYLQLRKVKVALEWGPKRDRSTWEGRLAVVVSRWREDDFFVATVPRLGPQVFAVRRLGELDKALKAWLEHRIENGKKTLPLDESVCRKQDFLQILTFDADLPSILPSQPERRGRGMRKKRKKKREEAEQSERKKKDRRLVPPVELRAVGRNLTHQAIDGRLSRAFLRDAIVDGIVDQLERDGAAILLVGPSGVGKSAIVGEVVRRIAAKSPRMQDRREVWAVDGNRIVSGMSFVGQWEQRVSNMVGELSARQDVLFVEDLPSLVFAGRTSQGDTNVADYLEPHLQRKELRMLGECTPERLLATRDESPGFFSRFRIVYVDPLDERSTLVCMAHALRARAEEEDVTVTPAGFEAILGLTRRFDASGVNPGRSIGLLQRVLADRTDFAKDSLERRQIDRREVVDHFGRQTGLPRFVLWPEEARPQSEIVDYFERRIVAQGGAVEAAVDVVSLLEQGLDDPERPLASFLFVGPTGVGKTETAKALAEFLFGSSDRLLRFDMSEFMAPHTVGRLIGDRWQPEGELTRRIHQQPFSVVLLDEIEKAHPAVHDALLQVLGEGRLTNAAGHTVRFTNAVVILTSNLGVREASKTLGFEPSTKNSMQLHYRRAAEKAFRPEFFNRIDRIVPFDSLGRDAILPLVRRLLEKMLGRRGLQRNSVVVDVDPELVGVLVDEGFDARYGARSIKRILEQRLAVPLARHLVAHHGDDLTIAELYPRDGSIEMVLSAPRRPEVVPVEVPELAKSWVEVESRHHVLQEDLRRLVDGPAAARMREQHREDPGLASGDRRAEHRAVQRLAFFAQLDAIEAELAELAEQMEVPVYEERFKVEATPDGRGGWLAHTPKHKTAYFTAGDVARPIQGTRAPFLPTLPGKVQSILLRLAALRFLCAPLVEGREDKMLLALRPVGVDPSAQRLAWQIAQAMTGAWASLTGAGGDEELPWIRSTVYARVQGELQRFDRLEQAVEGVVEAIELEGVGLRELVAPELGLHLDVVEVGADRMTRLVRVDEVAGEGDPIERLEALAARIAAYQRERRDADVAPPLEEVPLVREYESEAGTDPGTAQQIRVGEASDLLQVSLLRMLDRGDA